MSLLSYVLIYEQHCNLQRAQHHSTRPVSSTTNEHVRVSDVNSREPDSADVHAWMLRTDVRSLQTEADAKPDFC